MFDPTLNREVLVSARRVVGLDARSNLDYALHPAVNGLVV